MNNITKIGDTVRIVSISFDSLDEMFSDPNNEFYDESEKETYKQHVGKVGIVDYSERNNYFNCVFVCVKFANDEVITVVSYDVRKTDDDPTGIEFLPINNIESDEEYLPLTKDERQFADKAVMAMLSAGKFSHSDNRDIMNEAISLSICRSNMYSMLWDKTYQ